MEKSIFHKKNRENQPPTPYELIEPEIVHLKKGYSIRYGARPKPKIPLWLFLLAFCGLGWLYLMDPILHAWYKGEAVRTYLYLHNYGGGSLANGLVASEILSPQEAAVLNRRQGSFQDYYASPEAADQQAGTIINYMTTVRLLHAGKYEQLDPVGRMRYLLFIRTGIVVPTQWSFLDPSVGE
ncbi:MAG TPA: hypothetical protein VGZ93_12845 [Candidatus Methylacidiphilales bacterium]|jgi:hypothetical protein|nr:hypothetical protein [Candidatus Methylacidiphilales bacterium]